MTPRQMYRAMRKWKISVIFGRDGLFYAGEVTDGEVIDQLFTGAIRVGGGGSLHVGTEPEQAVEDYCNARNLEWNV